MDVTTASRPHTTPRPTQQYYVPKRLLECGRDPQSTPSTIKNEEKTSAPKPRPLMEKILAPPSNLKQNLQQKQHQQSPKKKKPSPTQNNNENRKICTPKRPPSSKKSSPPPPRELLLVTSTPSSRSSSSMSSISPTSFARNVRTELTISTPKVVHARGGPRKYSLPRPNAFAPTVGQSDDCNCDRKNTHVVCKRCGFECIGRVQITCGQHPMVLALNDFRECPNSVCRSIQIFEMDELENVDDQQIIDQLDIPIEKIDLLSNDD